MKRSERLIRGLAATVCIAAVGLGLAGWVQRWWPTTGGSRGEVRGLIEPGGRKTVAPGPVQVRRRLTLPIAVRLGCLRLLQFLAGVVAACLAGAVFILLGGLNGDSIAASTAVFVAVIEGFLTWLLPALFVEAS